MTPGLGDATKSTKTPTDPAVGSDGIRKPQQTLLDEERAADEGMGQGRFQPSAEPTPGPEADAVADAEKKEKS